MSLWDCRRNQINPKIKGYQNKIAKKENETERKINDKGYFEKKWTEINQCADEIKYVSKQRELDSLDFLACPLFLLSFFLCRFVFCDL